MINRTIIEVSLGQHVYELQELKQYLNLVLQTLLIPVEELLHSILDLNLVSPAEAMKLIYRDELSWGSIRLAGIKLYIAFETYGLYHKFRKFTDSEFLAGAHIDVAVANLTERWDSTTTAFRVVSIHSTIYLGTIEYRTVLLDTDDVLEIYSCFNSSSPCCGISANHGITYERYQKSNRHTTCGISYISHQYWNYRSSHYRHDEQGRG